jgi:fructosamine-3-kinase
MSSSGVLENPELDWVPPEATRVFEREEVERRLGPRSEPLEWLGGGHSNLNVRVGAAELERIYRTEPEKAAKEALLLTWPWQSFRVPELRRQGPDFLLLEYVAHTRLEASAPHARAVGRALAEIHARRFPRAGLLGADLTLSTKLEDFVSELTGYALSTLERMERPVARELSPEVRRFYVERRAALAEAAGPPVLLHGDFKVSNLHWAGGRLLVLDWEFCYAGSALMDIGQLLRWRPPAEFTREFALAYREAGGELPADFQAHAQAASHEIPWKHSCSIAAIVAFARLR